MPESGMLPGKRKDFITHSEERNKNQPKQDVCRLARFKIGRGKVGRMPARDRARRRATRDARADRREQHIFDSFSPWMFPRSGRRVFAELHQFLPSAHLLFE